jgi:leucine dehydrogenase|tara:strand:+ start:81 stop:1100 length:1020 start_codon:yes stop_codon:yes gene_type:complete
MIFLDITDTIFQSIDVSSHDEFDHEKVYYYEEPKIGFKSIIAIHSSSAGPAIGGCRYRNYSSFQEGLTDVLRLSKGMTEKNNAAKIPFGGGKAIIFADHPKSEATLGALANFLNLLEGAYYSAEDIGITLEDIKFVGQHSAFVFDNVDPGPYTAKGIFYSIEAALKYYLEQDLQNSSISIQGAGSVGLTLANHLADAGATVYIQDIDSSKLETIDRKNIIPVTNIMTQECDLLAPCAIGAILDSQSIRELQCLIIAGGANNQLKTIEIDDELLALGIHYVPDILINSGGVIGLTKDILDRNSNQIESDLQLIADRAVNFMKIGRTNKISILQAMSSLAS